MYNVIPHHCLLSKADGYGIKGKVHFWLNPFLDHRAQQVLIHGKASELCDVVLVPPVLLLSYSYFYISNLTSIINSPCKLFTDELVVHIAL